MTEFAIELLRLHGDENWSEWGDRWWDHVERLGELPSGGPGGGWRILDHFRRAGVEAIQLDWGTLLFPVTKQELLALFTQSGRLRPHAAQSDQEAFDLSRLPEDRDYGLVVVECA